jgi:hypothetical protein
MGNRNTLPSFGADPSYTTLSGWSGGAFMANNLHVIYSDTFKGVGMVNGGGYSTGEFLDNAGIFQYDLESSEIADKSVEFAQKFSDLGQIDNILNLKDQPVMIYTHGLDDLTHSTLQYGEKDFYE